MNLKEIQQLVSPQKIVENEMIRIKQKIFAEFTTIEAIRNVFDTWHEYFKATHFSPEEIKKYADTYWTWYIDISQKLLSGIEPDIAIEIFSYQWPYMVSLQYDSPLNVYTTYCLSMFSDDENLKRFHARVKQSLLQLDYPLNVSSEATYHFSTQYFFNFIRKKQLGDNNLDVARVSAQIEQEFFGIPAVDDKISSMRRKLFDDTIKFVELFVNDLDIIGYLNTYYALVREDSDFSVDPEVFERALWNKAALSDESTLSVDAQKSFDKVESEPLASLSYPHIRQTLETEFTYDDTDTLSPLEDVLQRLEELSHEYNDPQIQDLYYFDEHEGKFVWNDDLLH